MRISEAFSKMRLSDYCSSQDIDRAIAVTVDSFVGSKKVSCKRPLARAFAKYVLSLKPIEVNPDIASNRYTLAKPGSRSARQPARSDMRAGRATTVEA